MRRFCFGHDHDVRRWYYPTTARLPRVLFIFGLLVYPIPYFGLGEIRWTRHRTWNLIMIVSTRVQHPHQHSSSSRRGYALQLLVYRHTSSNLQPSNGRHFPCQSEYGETLQVPVHFHVPSGQNSTYTYSSRRTFQAIEKSASGVETSTTGKWRRAL